MFVCVSGYECRCRYEGKKERRVGTYSEDQGIGQDFHELGMRYPQMTGAEESNVSWFVLLQCKEFLLVGEWVSVRSSGHD